MRTERRRRGSALIDVLVALVVLAIGGTALIAMVGQTAHSLRDVAETERQIRRASGELEGLVAWSRADVESRVGASTLHGWRLEVVRVSPDLYDASIAPPVAGAVLLETTLYRPDTISTADHAPD